MQFVRHLVREGWFAVVQLLSRVHLFATPGQQYPRLLCPSIPSSSACDYDPHGHTMAAEIKPLPLHSGQEEAGWHEIPITLLRMTCNLTLVSYLFLDFSI